MLPLFRSTAAVALAFTAMPGGVNGSATNNPVEWSAPIEIATGPGERGPWQQNESRYNYVDDPCVVLTDGNAAIVVWVNQARKAVLLQRFGADGQSQLPRPVNVSRQPATFSWLPRVAVNPRRPDQVCVLWQEIIFSGGSHGGEILFARSDNGGATFHPPINLSNSMAGDGKGRISREFWHNGSLDLNYAPDGLLYAAWTEYEGALWFSHSTNHGESFSPPRQIHPPSSAGSEPARAPTIASATNGLVWIAWTTGENPRANVLIARSTDAGQTFESPRVATRTDGYSDSPKLAIGPDGVVHLVFSESDDMFGPGGIRHTRSTDGGRNFRSSIEISRPGSGVPEAGGFPALSLDARGNLIVVWERFPRRRDRPRGLGFTLSRDGGRTFAPPAVVPGSLDSEGGVNGSFQGLLMSKLSVNRHGSIAVVNSSLVPERRSRVWLVRGTLPAASAGQ